MAKTKFYTQNTIKGIDHKTEFEAEEVCVEFGGVFLYVGTTDEGILLRWGNDRKITERVPIQPVSHNSLVIPKLRAEAKAPTVKTQPTPARVRRARR